MSYEKSLIEKNHKKEDIKQLFNDICKHKKEYDEYSSDFDWSKCTDCVLNETVHYVPHGYSTNDVVKRNVCFVVWHDRILEGVI